MTDEHIRSAFVTLPKPMTTQAEVVAFQDQAMEAQANRVIRPHVKQNASTATSRLRDFTRMNPPMFYESKLNEDPQDIIDDLYKIIHSMELTSNETVKQASYEV